jgi:methyl-accepting chemotaxis protein
MSPGNTTRGLIRMTILKRFSLGSSLRAQLTLTMAALISASVLAMAYIGYQRIEAKIGEDLDVRTDWSLRVAVRIMAEGAPVFNVVKNASEQPEVLKLNLPTSVLDALSAHELTRIVDQISEANLGTATIFRWKDDKKDFERIATTVKKPDGSRAIGTTLGQNGAVYPYMMRKQAYRGIAMILGEPYQTGYLPIVDAEGKPVGILYIGVGKIKDLAVAGREFLRDLAIGGGLVLAIAMLLTMFATSRVLHPLGRVADATDALASGKEDVEIPHRERQDQIGTIARAVDGFSEAVARQRHQERANQEEVERVAQRKAEMDQQVEHFRVSVRECLDQLRGGAEKLRTTSEGIRTVIDHASDRVTAGRDAADGGAAAISEVATATNQFASSITEIAARSNDAATIVRKASETGQHAEQIASELATAVGKISTAVAFISSIASQTNLLALNATIEAARAGEAGKGFAVVASEVKELSNGTSKAATEIAELVKSIEGVTASVTDATREIGDGLSAINETTLVIAAAVTEQEQVTRDIAANADSAAQRGEIIRSGFDDVQGAIDNTSDAASELDKLSRDFAASSDVLVKEIEDFLIRMAA